MLLWEGYPSHNSRKVKTRGLLGFYFLLASA